MLFSLRLHSAFFYFSLPLQRDVNSNQKQTNTILHLVVLFFVEIKYDIFNLLQDDTIKRLTLGGIASR